MVLLVVSSCTRILRMQTVEFGLLKTEREITFGTWISMSEKNQEPVVWLENGPEQGALHAVLKT